MNILFKMIGLQFKILLRDRMLLVSSLGIAVVSMLIFGFMFGNTANQATQLGVVDLDKSQVSAQVIASLKSNDALKITEGSQTALLDDMKNANLSAVVVIQPGFGAGLMTGQARVQFYADESDVIGAARIRGTVYGTFDAISKQAAGFKDRITVDEQKVTIRQQRMIDVLTPGMMGMAIMFANMYVGVALITWRERGTLKRLSATPLKSWQLIAAQMFSQLCLSILQVALILGLGAMIFDVTVKLEWLPVIGLLTLVGTFSIISLGYAVGNFVQKQQAAQSVVTLISLPMMFLSGSYFVVAPPDFLKPLVEILPLTHLNRALRQIMLNDAGLNGIVMNLVILMAFGVVLLAISVRTFRWSR